ncbi:hypothetical protein [Rhodopila globiformis]|uniref:Uncharacterized protein n=1 Tax=Rhodopila globiformis TaxID=1071 RepID=A0A2S6N273_RHOGL|nr:hypothetical protein [Rhodopila globiformis]PPQ28709.1 hypothetical protein CCS01_23750 [Rhodopila globiformis]
MLIWLAGITALLVGVGVGVGVGVAAPRHPASTADRQGAVCRPGQTDDTLRPLPPALVLRARAVFGLAMPDDLIRRATVYRCLDGRTLLCTAGANLVCGKANTRRDLPGVAAWCRDHRDVDSVPMFVTGHDTAYRWRCADGAPLIVATEAVDARGFLSRNWKDGDGRPD